MTQDQVAKRLEISRSSVAMYESGSREPDFEMLESIADLFNVNMRDLVGEEKEKPFKLEELTPEKAEFIDLIQKMTPEQVRALIAVAKLTLHDQ